MRDRGGRGGIADLSKRGAVIMTLAQGRNEEKGGQVGTLHE